MPSQNSFEFVPKFSPRSKRKSPGGVATTDLVFSAYVAGNAEVFSMLAKLHLPPGAEVADVTYGKGVFWRDIPDNRYAVRGTDLKAGIDCRSLPYKDDSLDAVVFDPPYMEGLFRRSKEHLAGSGTHKAFREHYSDGEPTAHGPKYHEAVLALYYDGGKEACRVLRNGGVLIVKCQDEVSANTQRLTHVELINYYATLGFYCKDLFVVVRANRPGVSRVLEQVHARKCHSYFLVFVKHGATWKNGTPRARPAAGKGLRRQAANEPRTEDDAVDVRRSSPTT